ncbi:MAG: hypothetical protein D6721_10660 [Gammaproteobacteria bacterium]|nr:MAG: hypothetical protein D6721_10660 [Gammaproteobacteria bacterium]
MMAWDVIVPDPPVMTSPTIENLRRLLGVEVEYQGRRCRVVEILEEGPQIVVQCLEHRTIQPNQYGDASRRVPETHAFPVARLDPEFLARLLQAASQR